MPQLRISRNSQEDHDKMVKQMVKKYEGMQCAWIQADIDGYPTPPSLKNPFDPEIRPDIYCLDIYTDPVVCEVETADTISDEHTEKQRSALDRYAKRVGGRFHIAIPEGSYDDVEDRLVELGITGVIVFTLGMSESINPPSYA